MTGPASALVPRRTLSEDEEGSCTGSASDSGLAVGPVSSGMLPSHHYC